MLITGRSCTGCRCCMPIWTKSHRFYSFFSLAFLAPISLARARARESVERISSSHRFSFSHCPPISRFSISSVRKLEQGAQMHGIECAPCRVCMCVCVRLQRIPFASHLFIKSACMQACTCPSDVRVRARDDPICLERMAKCEMLSRCVHR